MATEDLLRRKYQMTDADLTMFTSNLVNDMTRDLTQLAVFGVTTPNITNLQALCDDFESLATDIELEADLMEATEAKNTKVAEVKEVIRNMALRVDMKWGADSPKYKRLMITGMNSATDNDLIVTARRVHRVMTDYLTDLASLGLTSGMLDDFEELNQAFEDAKNLCHDKVNARAIAAQNRLADGNELYGLVAKYCDMGKRIWVNTDPAKYADYVIYPTVTTGLSKPQNLTANWTLGDTVVHLTCDTVSGATTYEIFSSAVDFGLPSGTYSSLGEFPTPTQGVAYVADKRNYYKVKAKNATQTSDYSEEAWTEVVINV